MKTRAVSMVLLMIASALAGCASGDPDGDGTSGIDMEILNEMIDDNLQDFINNTSVTVHQEIHYHNNTTYVDNSESNMNVGGSTGNGTSSSSVIQVMRINQEFYQTGTNIGDIQFILNGNLQFPAIGYAPTMTYNTEGMVVSMDFTCEEAINARDRMENHHWREWARYELNVGWSTAESLGDDIWYDMYELEDELREYCGWNQNWVGVGVESTLFQIYLSEGEALSFTQWDNTVGSFHWNLSCDDGYYATGNWWSIDNSRFIGGWTDCIFTGLHDWSIGGSWNNSYFDSNGSISYPPEIPIWYQYNTYSYWKVWETTNEESAFDGIFYFTKYFVMPVE